MKKLLTLLLSALYAWTLTALTETVNGIPWNYKVSNGKAEIYSIVDDYGDINPAIPWSTSGAITIPSTLGGYPVTSIGERAFDGCNRLTSVTIPEGVTSIGGEAFSGCRSLTSVTIPSSVKSIGDEAFFYCTSLTFVTILEGVTSIGDGAFYECSSLTSVTIPSSVTSIGDEAFSSCSGLYKDANGVQYESEDKVVLIDVPISVSGSFEIPSSVRFIHSSAFSGCTSLTSVTIPASVTTIGRSAFSGCSGLTSVTIPEGVTTIGDGAFWGCSNLFKDENGVQYESEAKVVLISVPTSTTGNFTIPNSVRFIDSEAFYECSSLTSVTIPSSVTSIGSGAFADCESLTSVTIPSNVTSIGDAAFRNCSSLTSVTIPEGVTSIGWLAFYGCSSLTSVTIPSSVTSIGDYAFYSCSRLTSVTIPEGVTSIGGEAFRGCRSLTSVTIPSSVTSIGGYAFYGCSSLTLVTFEGEPPAVGSSAFSDVASWCEGYYPSTKASAWAAVISNGTWNGLIMDVYTPLTLPETVTGETAEWLKTTLENEGVSGVVTLATGVTIETLEQARLLGIEPAIDGSEVAVASTFEVSDVAVTAEAVTLKVVIMVERGTLPDNFTLGGEVNVMMSQALGGNWTEVIPEPSDIVITRIDDTQATVSVTYNKTDYKFFKVIVK